MIDLAGMIVAIIFLLLLFGYVLPYLLQRWKR